VFNEISPCFFPHLRREFVKILSSTKGQLFSLARMHLENPPSSEAKIRLLFVAPRERSVGRRLSRCECPEETPYDRCCSPCQSYHHPPVYNIPPRVWQPLHSRDNRSYTKCDAPAHSHPLFGRVEQPHRVERGQQDVQVARSADDQSPGPRHDKGGKLFLKSLVTLGVCEKQGRGDVRAELDRSQGDRATLPHERLDRDGKEAADGLEEDVCDASRPPGRREEGDRALGPRGDIVNGSGGGYLRR